jgi:hypothetical protein
MPSEITNPNVNEYYVYDDETSYGVGDLCIDTSIGADNTTVVDTTLIDGKTGDDKRTMTEEEYLQNQENIKKNEDSLIGKAIDSTLTAVKGALETVQAPFDAVKSALTTAKDAVANTIANIGISAKILLPLTVVIGILVSGYYLLKMGAETKRNIKTIKGKK